MAQTPWLVILLALVQETKKIQKTVRLVIVNYIDILSEQKKNSALLKQVLDNAIKIINFVKTPLLQCTVLKILSGII